MAEDALAYSVDQGLNEDGARPLSCRCATKFLAIRTHDSGWALDRSLDLIERAGGLYHDGIVWRARGRQFIEYPRRWYRQAGPRRRLDLKAFVQRVVDGGARGTSQGNADVCELTASPYGVIIEWHQSGRPHRAAKSADRCDGSSRVQFRGRDFEQVHAPDAAQRGPAARPVERYDPEASILDRPGCFDCRHGLGETNQHDRLADG